LRLSKRWTGNLHSLQETFDINATMYAWWLVNNSPLGTPRGRYDEHSSKSSLSCETNVYRTSRRKAKLQKVMLASFVTLRTMAPEILLVCLHLAATWNLHTTQPRTFLPTYDEVINLTGLL
jgi:hypothetical protein